MHETKDAKHFNNNFFSEFEESFSIFDLDADGVITTEELGTVMVALGQRPSRLELEALIQGVDNDSRCIFIKQ